MQSAATLLNPTRKTVLDIEVDYAIHIPEKFDS